MQNSFYYTFEHFLIERWGEPDDGDSLEKRRQKAYQRFVRAVGNKVASKKTIRKWFSLDGSSLPSREHILRIGMALGLSIDETEEYLTYGVSEPQLQVNDYMEFAAMYCLDHKLGYPEYEMILEFYEMETESDTEIHQTAHTDRLLNLYQQVKDYDQTNFMVWMCRNAELFKGYSKTTYNYFESLKDECLDFFREDMKASLEISLAQTDFYEWVKEQEIAIDEIGENGKKEAIRRYVKNRQRGKHSSLSKGIQKEIQDFCTFAYSSQDRVCDLLVALDLDTEVARREWREIHLTSRKYISELLAISSKKEKQMELRRELVRLKKREEEEEILTEERKKLRRALTMQSSQVRMITRSDLLLLIQYVAGRRYQKEVEQQGKAFRGAEAKEQFVVFANTILSGCKMRLLDEKYRLDAALLSCFRDDEMILFFELLRGEEK